MAAETLGLVLAGGLARRMGGGDKPLRLLGGRPLLDHVLARITPQVAAVVLNANGDPARFAGFGLPVVADAIAPSSQAISWRGCMPRGKQPACPWPPPPRAGKATRRRHFGPSRSAANCAPPFWPGSAR